MFDVDVRLKGRTAGTSVPAATNFFLSGQVLHSVLTVQAGHSPSSCSLLQLATPSEGSSFSFPEKSFASGCVQELESYFTLCRLMYKEEAKCKGNRDFINMPCMCVFIF